MIGARIRRVEGHRLVTGRGRFTDDLTAPGAAFAAFVRSSHAHANVIGIDTGAAHALPGVLGVFDANDLAAWGVRDHLTGAEGRSRGFRNRDGTPMAAPVWFPLARGRVRHVGEPVAMVVAENAALAEQAAEAVIVDYDPLPAVTDAALALRPGAPRLWDTVPGNLCYDWGRGDMAAVDSALAGAAHVSHLDVVIPRIAAAFMEPRAALADYDAATGRFTLHVGCQAVHGLRAKLAYGLGVVEGDVRVVSLDVGGAFGARSVIYPEYVPLLWAARALGRPLRWRATRAEEFLTTTQGRDSVLAGELGLDVDGNFVVFRAHSVTNMGARHTGNGPFSVMQNLARMLSGVYRFSACAMTIRGAFTNTPPVSSYRGVGRMEAIYLLERLIDQAARATGRDRIALRRQNLIAPDAFPYTTPTGACYDSGDYARGMDLALAAADWDGFADRRVESQARGQLRGIALINFIEGAGGGAGEYGALGIEDGRIVVHAGCVAQGQGHQTTLAQIAADRLGVAVGDVAVAASDSDAIADGVGTNASRSMVRAGTALAEAAEKLIENGRATAARLLQAREDAVSYDAGRYRVAGSDRSAGLFEVAAAMAEAGIRPFAESRHEHDAVTYPNGCHVCEVEVDPETGAVAILRFTAVDDVGRAVNPVIVHGQSQGGIVQGIGQALMEEVVFDTENGQALSGSFMDYAMPRAAHVPSLEPIANDVPSPTNPLGVKGAGEGGTTGAPVAVINAVLDALVPMGVTGIEMPATPQKIWAAIRMAAQGVKGE